MKALCKKTLIHCDGSESFTKGVEYEFIPGTRNFVINLNTNLIDNQNDPHVLDWEYAKHFKLVK